MASVLVLYNGPIYTFTAAEPGVFLYEAGPLTNALHQTAMGLHGALIVRPATVGQAYNSAATAYDVEAVLVLSELDPALNASASPATFNMSNFAPEYELINGAAFPNAAVINVGLRCVSYPERIGVRHEFVRRLAKRFAEEGIQAPPVPYMVPRKR